MIDFGFDKIALIGAVALIVIGPEKLPRVARTVGHLVGKAQRYVADVKAEVNRSIELEELKKMKTEFEDAARNVHDSVSKEVHQTKAELESSWSDADNGILPPNSGQHEGWVPPPLEYKHPKKNWRLKRGATPQWYKQRAGVRVKAQSGAARVARFRPPRSVA
ncbi:MAG: Sec-independent protein translocase protein TatB [Burkholderiales bacterium]